MVHVCVFKVRDPAQGLDLTAHVDLDLHRAEVDLDAAEVLSIGVTRVGPDRDARGERVEDALPHRVLIARVSAAGDVGGGDDGEELTIDAGGDEIREFAEVAVEVDGAGAHG
jgi:hypothetical protein